MQETEYDIKFIKLDGKKKKKIEDDGNYSEAVWNRFKERLSETKKKEAVEPQTKRVRSNASETIQLMKERYENVTEIRLKELKLKKELKSKESEKNEKQTEALILKGQLQTHLLITLLGKLIKKWHLLWKVWCFLKLFLEIYFVWFSLLLSVHFTSHLKIWFNFYP